MTTYYIIVFFALLMLYLAYQDQKSFTKGQHADYKTLMVSSGVLGTFLGIFLGLYNFNTLDIDKSVPLLLDGLKFAFVTSIMGMGLSVFLSVIQKGKESSADDELGILSEISRKLDPLNLMGNVATNTVQTNEQIKNFRMEIRDEQLKLRNFIEDNFKKTNASLEEAIKTLSKGATEEIIKALEEVIADFNRNLTEQFGENFKQLNWRYLHCAWKTKKGRHKNTCEKISPTIH